MYQKLAIIALAAALGAAAPGCKKSQTTTEFKSQEYKFKAKFPGKPKEEEQTAMGMKLKMFGVETRNGMCGVAVTDMPIPAGESDAKIQDRLDGARDGAIRNVGGTQKSSSAITLAGKYPGREYTASITQPTKGLTRARIYLVGARLYQVIVMGTESYANSSEMTAFLDSFTLLE